MSDLINQSGQILVVDGIRINGQSDTPAVSAAKSMIAVGNTPAESVRSEFLNRYRCVAEGEKRILSGTTLTAKVYDSTTGNEVSGISESEFTWSDADGNTIATGINHVTLNAHDHMDGKNEKQFILIWEHTVKYFIGTSERAVTVKQNIFFTLTTDTTKEYMWLTAINEDDISEADKKSGDWKTTVGPKPNDGNTYYLWTRVSYDLGITFIYYKSTTYEGPYDSVSHPYNPEAKIKLVLDKYYFERQDKKADGSKGDYIPKQVIKYHFEYDGVDSNTRVHMYSSEGYNISNSLDSWPKLSDEAAITEKHMRDRSYMNIIVEYNGIIVDRVLVSERIITPDFAGKLDTDRPKTINGRAPSEGDSFFYINSSNQIILRVYQNNNWHDLDGSYSTDDSGVGIPNQHFADVMSKALPYIMKRGESLPVSETGPYSFFQNLAAYSAFIENLFVRNLNVENTVFKTVIGIDSSGNITFKVTYNGNTIFQIDPTTGNVFIGKPNANMSAPEYGFMFKPADNTILAPNAKFQLNTDGSLYTNYMVADNAKIDKGEITNVNIQNCVLGGRLDTDVLRVIQNGISNETFCDAPWVSYWNKGTRAYYAASAARSKLASITSGDSTTFETIDIYLMVDGKVIAPEICKMKVVRVTSSNGPDNDYVYFYDKNMNVRKLSEYGYTKISHNGGDYSIYSWDLYTCGGTAATDSNGNTYAYVDYDIDTFITIYRKKIDDKLFASVPFIDGAMHTVADVETNQVYVDSNGNLKVKLS